MGNEDGKVIIGVEANLDKFDKQMKLLEKAYEKKEIDVDYTEDKLIDAQYDLKEINKTLEEQRQKYKDLEAEVDNYDKLIKEASQKYNEIFQQRRATPGYNEQVYQMMEEEKRLQNAMSEYRKKMTLSQQKQGYLSPEIAKTNEKYREQEEIVKNISSKLEKQKLDLETIGAKIGDNTQKQQEYYDKINLKRVEQDSEAIGKSLGSTIRNTIRWGIAIFGVQTAFSFIRSNMSILSQYDKKLAADLEYIRFVIANTLKPVIEYLIKLAYRLLTYIGYIAKAWFGVNLFANASTKAFEKNNKALGGSVKKTKELNKQLAGFDEMNVLQDNGNVSGGGGGGGLPSQDLSNLDNIEVPGWIKWIADHGKEVLAIILGIFTALKLLSHGLSFIKALGIGAIVAGIVLLLGDIKDYIKDPCWENFTKILSDIAIIIGGIMLVMGNWWGLLVIIVAAIVRLVADNWNSIKETLSGVWNWIYDKVIEPIYKKFKWLFDNIIAIGKWWIELFVSIFTTVWENIKAIAHNIKEIFTALFEAIKFIFSPLVNFFLGIWNKIKGGVKKFATAVGDTITAVIKGAINGALAIMEKIINTPIRAINKLIKVINKVPGIELSKLEEYKLPRLAKGGIINMPGRGVPVGSAIAGERRAEGVIPLTDSQQMNLLGEAIGKYININATIPVYVGNRQVAREIRIIEAEENFAYNGG